MRTTAFALLSVVGAAAAQGVTEQIAPTAPSPPGCTGSFNGTFEVQVRAAVSKRDPPVEVSPSLPSLSLINRVKAWDNPPRS